MNSLSKRFMDICGRILLITPFLFLLSDVLSPPAVPALPGDEVTAAAESFSKLPPGSAPAITRAMLAGLPEEYQLQEDGNSFSLSNPSHGIDIAFSPDGLEVKSGGKSWGMALSGIGYSGSVKPVQKAMLINDNGRMVYQRGDVSEWYINSRWGVEQGFTIRKDPGGKDSGLVVELTISGDVQLSLDADTLVLADAQGNSIARYTGLQVFDADNKSLPAQLMLAGTTLRILVDDAHAQYPVTIDPWIQQAKLTTDWERHGFGSSVAISGDTIVVGTDGGDYAYVFVKPVSGWSGLMKQTAILTPNDKPQLGFGCSVAISGDMIVVGAGYFADYPGSAYVFARPVDGWTGLLNETAKLTPNDGVQFKNFGSSVAISGDTIVVGARFDDESRGSVYVFVKPNSGWVNMTQTAKLTASDGAAYDLFGNSVAISGDTIIVGANSSNTGLGTVYVFVKPSSGWANMTQTAKLTAIEANYHFGESVAISGDTIVTGGNIGYYDQGFAFVFVKPSGGWTNTKIPTARLTASDGAEYDRFGNSVSISGDTIVVGADGDDFQRGSAYVFARPQSGWTNMIETAKLAAGDGASGDQFGSSAAFNGGTIVVGADGYDNYSGSAYIFMLGAAVINTEQWRLLLDNGQGAANLTLSKKEDGTITADGNWKYLYQGSTNVGTFIVAPVTISGKFIALTATGTATNLSAPPGYTTSPYTGVFSGTAFDGQGSGTFTVTFQAYGWPKMITGNWQGTRTSGSGITAFEIQALPWLMLLLKD